MRYVKFTDRAKEWIKDNKTLLLQIGAATAIAVLVAGIMIPSMAVMPRQHAEAMTRVDEGISHVGAEIADLARAITGVSGDLAETEETVAGYDAAIDGIGQRLDDVEDALEQVQASAPEAWLTGEAGNYTLHAKSSTAGTFTASVVLCYSPPLALNATSYSDAVDAFFGLLDPADDDYRHYTPALSRNDTAWGITSISFNIGAFTIEEGATRTVSTPYGGLPEGYEPDWAYAEIYPVLKKS